MTTAALPLLRLDDESPEQTIDFVHIDSIAARSVVHNWMILAHRHRNLFQILLIERGGGEMTFETTAISFAAPCAILVPATVAHGFRLRRAVTDGWVITFSENIAAGIGKEGETLAPLKALAVDVERSSADRWAEPSISPVGFVPWWLSALHVFYDSWLHERDVLLPLGIVPPIEPR